MALVAKTRRVGDVDVIDLSGPQKAAPKEVQQAKAKDFFASMSDLLKP